MITRFIHRDLHNAEAVTFNERIIARIERHQPLPPSVAKPFAEFDGYTAKMKALVQRAQAARLSDELQDADALRDQYGTALFELCSGFSKCENAERVAAGKLLLEALAPYGSATEVARSSYDQQSTLVENIVRDLGARPDLAGAVDTLGLSSLLEAYNAANRKFRDLQEQRTDDERAGADDYEMLRLRRACAATYTELVKQLESAFNFTGGAAPWTDIIDVVSQIASETADTLARRKSAATEAPSEAPTQG